MKMHNLCVGGSLAALGLALGSPAIAQESPARETTLEQETGPTDDAADEEIVVTGSNISGVKQVGSQSIVLGREDVLAAGKNSVADVLRTLPQVQNVSGSFDAATTGPSGSAQNGMSNATRGTAINFRGVGQGATLTLVDGHRITPSGTASAFTEANQVPIAAIERIEVIADGASAVYGSDAIAGVINYVLRKDFQGVELSGRYTAAEYGNDEWALSGVAGLSWNPSFGSGNIIATFEYSRRDPYLRGSNPRLRSDQRPYGGNDGRYSGNAASVPLNGNIYVPTVGGATNPNNVQAGANIYYTLPLNPTGRILTLADLREVRTGSCVGAATATCATAPNLVDRADYEDYLSKQTRKQAAVFISQDIGDLSLYDEFFWNRTDQFTRTFNASNGVTSPSVTIAPTSPYYIALPGNTGPLTVQLNVVDRLPNGPAMGNANFDESFNNTFGARLGLFADLKLEAYYNFGQNKTCGVCYLGNFISFETTNGLTGAAAINALQNLVNRPVTDPLAFNPLSTAPFTQAQLDYILGNNKQYAQNWSHDIVAKVDGTLFDFAGGAWKFAVGGEYYAGIQKLQNAANRPPDPGSITTPDANARTVRKQYAAFGELYMPLVAEDMDVPAVRELILSAALRYDHYSDFGQTTNGKVSATWEVFEGLRLRGSWGTSFRAPGLPELNAGAQSFGLGGNVAPINADIAAVFAAMGGTRQANGSVNVLWINGSNPNLKAETGRNWQVGADFTPAFAPGLRLSATYYNITYDNKLGGSGVPITVNAFVPGSLANLTQFNRYRPYVIALNNVRSGGGCTSLDPRIAEFTFLYTANAGFNPRDYCAADVIIDARSISAAKTVQEGIDGSINYSTATDIGLFNINLSVSKILHNSEATVAGFPLVQRLDTIGDPISWRGRGNITYSNGPFSASLFGNYVGSYVNDLPITLTGAATALPQTRIPSWTTFDLSLAFSFPRGDERWKFMRGVRLGLSVSNVFDNDPPYLQSVASGNSSIDLFAHNAFGRSMQVSLTKAF